MEHGAPHERRFRIVELGGALPVGYALNDAGLVAGEVWDSARSCVKAALVVDGALHELPVLGGSFSRARGINNRGDVVGDALTPGDASHHAFLVTGGVTYDLNNLIDDGSGWELLHGLAINNSGTILALGSRDGVDRLCLVVPRARGT